MCGRCRSEDGTYVDRGCRRSIRREGPGEFVRAWEPEEVVECSFRAGWVGIGCPVHGPFVSGPIVRQQELGLGQHQNEAAGNEKFEGVSF